jgi:hypothetical protein
MITATRGRYPGTTEEPFPLLLAYLRLFQSLRRDNRPELDTDTRQALILRGARLATTEGGVDTVRKLIALRAVVRECDDPDSSASLTELLKDFRAQIAGHRDPERAELLTYPTSEPRHHPPGPR